MLKNASQFVLLCGLILTLNSCATTAGIGLGPGQEFVLGEQNQTAYRAELRNKGKQPITVRAVNRKDNSIREEITLQASEKVKLKVFGNENIYLSNPNTLPVQVKARLTKNVKGMRYQDIPK